MWWKNLKTSEYKELKLQIELLWIEIDILTQRYKRKVKPKELPQEEQGSETFDDGFDELRKLNKEAKP